MHLSNIQTEEGITWCDIFEKSTSNSIYNMVA